MRTGRLGWSFKEEDGRALIRAPFLVQPFPALCAGTAFGVRPRRERIATHEVPTWLATARCRTQTLLMPIATEHRWYYLIDWRELSHLIRFGRAKRCCEHCGRFHGQDVTHLGDGTWWGTAEGTWRDGHGWRVRNLLLLRALEERLALFVARLGRVEPRRWAPVYLQGLLGPGERKSVEPLNRSGPR